MKATTTSMPSPPMPKPSPLPKGSPAAKPRSSSFANKNTSTNPSPAPSSAVPANASPNGCRNGWKTAGVSPAQSKLSSPNRLPESKRTERQQDKRQAQANFAKMQPNTATPLSGSPTYCSSSPKGYLKTERSEVSTKLKRSKTKFLQN